MTEENFDKALVQCRFQQQTLDKLENIRKITGEENRALLVAESLTLTEKIIEEQIKGGKLVIEDRNENKKIITLKY